MNFIEASNIIRQNKSGIELSVQLSSSANLDPILLFLKANAKLRDLNLNIKTLPFGTLGQALISQNDNEIKEILIIFPWDILPELDWRSGVPVNMNDMEKLIAQSVNFVNNISKRNCTIFYLPAPALPIFINQENNKYLVAKLIELMSNSGAILFNKNFFSLESYLAYGAPFQSCILDNIASNIINELQKSQIESAKVLITDLDNVLWSGLAAEDGPEGILCKAEGKGYKHFIYQTLLLKLKQNGILLAAVSRNDLDVAKAPINENKTLFSSDDFIEIYASYEPKSYHIKRLANNLNLGVESFVFIDDNPVEIEEVKQALPNIRCIRFPENEDQFIIFIDDIIENFNKTIVTSEDLQKTELYRRKLNINQQILINDQGGNLFDFLSNLSMELVIFDRSKSEYERSIQLINKTNQFNLNGDRLTIEEIKSVILDGGKLYSAKLSDRTGEHGEILACLIDNSGCILSFVLSCRVFQREVEFVFICKLIEILKFDLKFKFKKTTRNTPISNFLSEICFSNFSNLIYLNSNQFYSKNAYKLDLFKIKYFIDE